MKNPITKTLLTSIISISLGLVCFAYIGNDVLSENFSYLLLAGYIGAIFVAIISTALSILGAATFLADPLSTKDSIEDDRIEWPYILAALIGTLFGVLSFFGVLYIFGL